MWGTESIGSIFFLAGKADGPLAFAVGEQQLWSLMGVACTLVLQGCIEEEVKNTFVLLGAEYPSLPLNSPLIGHLGLCRIWPQEIQENLAIKGKF